MISRVTFSSARRLIVLLVVFFNGPIVGTKSWPPSPKFFHNLRMARRASISRYVNPGYADEVLWIPMCATPGNCDYYTQGSSQCIIHTGFEKVPSTNSKSQPHVLLNSNCQLRGSNGGPFYFQIYHCPRNLPIALFLLPKSGTTSSLNWLLGHEDVWPSLDHAASAMRESPSEMMHWLGSEAAWWMVGEDAAKMIANRVMHRYPATPESLHEAKEVTKHMKFLPPAHLCPMCCAKGLDRLKVVVARNPFVRLASFFKYRFLQSSKVSPSKEKLRSTSTSSTSSEKNQIFEASESERVDEDERSKYSHLPDSHLPKQLRSGAPPSPDEPYYDSWNQFPVWVERFLQMRERTPFHSNADLFPSRETKRKCLRSETGDAGTYNCVNYEFEFDASDVFHARPFHDMVRDTRLGENMGWTDWAEVDPETGALHKKEGVFVLHLETIEQDLEELYDQICSSYGMTCDRENWYEPWSGKKLEKGGNLGFNTSSDSVSQNPKRVLMSLDEMEKNDVGLFGDYGLSKKPDSGQDGEELMEDITSDFIGDERFAGSEVRFDRRNGFPKVFPTFNKRPESYACDFDPKKMEFSKDCKVTWEELWRMDGGQAAEMVRKHFNFDFRVLGYEEDWRNVMPIKMTTLQTEDL